MKGALLSVSVGAARPASLQAATLRCAEEARPLTADGLDPTVTFGPTDHAPTDLRWRRHNNQDRPPVPLGAVSEPVGDRSDVCRRCV